MFRGLYEITPRAGYFLQGRTHGLEAALQWSEKGEPVNNYGPSVGLEAGVHPAAGGTPFVLGPKVGYEVELVVIGGRLDLAYYLGSANSQVVGDLRLTPQLGLSGLGYLNLFYGYAIPLAGTEIDGLGRHRLSIFWNFLADFGKIGG